MLKAIGKFIRGQHDWVEPLFKKGGKLERLYPLYEAHDTFVFTPGEVAHGSTHVRDAIDLKRMMSMVVFALLPCILMALFNTGYQANRLYEQGLAGLVENGMSEEEARLQLGIDAPEDTTVGAYLYTLATSQKYDLDGGEDDGLPAPNWRMPILKALGADVTDAGSFYSNLYSPWYLYNSMLHGLLYFFPIWLVGLAAGGICEAIFAVIRRHEINEGFLVTSTLYPLTLPPDMPLWQVAVGIIFGVVVGKEIFGGTGRNFLNPALTARAFLYFNNAPYISGDKVWTAVDGYSGATGLGALSVRGTGTEVAQTLNDITGSMAGVPVNASVSWSDAFFGNIHGSMGETSTLCCLIGAAILIAAGVGSWRIMLGTILGLGVFSGLLSQLDWDTAIYATPPWWHMVLGGFAFGTVFMATDPVSASMTNTGKWIYGLIIGIMTIMVRAINPSFSEGIMLAILFANCCAPLIDYFVVQANISRRKARNVA